MDAWHFPSHAECMGGAYTHQEYLLNADGKMEFSFSFKGI